MRVDRMMYWGLVAAMSRVSDWAVCMVSPCSHKWMIRSTCRSTVSSISSNAADSSLPVASSLGGCMSVRSAWFPSIVRLPTHHFWISPGSASRGLPLYIWTLPMCISMPTFFGSRPRMHRLCHWLYFYGILRTSRPYMLSAAALAPPLACAVGPCLGPSRRGGRRTGSPHRCRFLPRTPQGLGLHIPIPAACCRSTIASRGRRVPVPIPPWCPA